MVNQELDYEIPWRPLTIAWLVASIVILAIALGRGHIVVSIVFAAVVLLWVNFCSTVVHYALDADEFNKWPIVGAAFVRFQSHHFPKWINVIHQKPVLDLVGELNPFAIINLVSPLLLFRMHSREVFVTWASLMLVGGYAMICHRWAHLPPRARPAFATALQRARLALRPEVHWRHHALAVNPGPVFVPNFDLSFGWSNAVMNPVFRRLPSPRLWLIIMAALILGQVPLLTLLLRWLER
ncbi:MAG TPA: fatty acid desaturase CarF family protein [Candidatus Aquilonibacter sp.]|nr:fatty acid desaturase CarF family protein [Candidatus Aquilonibacter sp.]